MKRWKDPFPQTPQGFHRRVERTLGGLEDNHMKHLRYRKLAIAAVAALIALMAATAVAVVAGSARFRQALTEGGADEVAALVQEVHRPGEGADESAEDGFALNIDEIIWEDDSLYFTYSIHVPEDGSEYLVALYSPLLNGESMVYDAKGWVSPNFFDDHAQSALVLGGGESANCGDLLTFKVNPALRDRAANALYLRADFMKADYPFAAFHDWDSEFGLPRPGAMPLIWENIEQEDLGNRTTPEERGLRKQIEAAAGEDGILTVEELTGTGCAEFITRREVRMALDASRQEQVIYDGVRETEFELNGCKVTVESFRMTHLGARIDLRATAPAGLTEEEGMRMTSEVIDPAPDGVTSYHYSWMLLREDGRPLPAVDPGSTGGAGYQPLPDGTASYHFSVQIDGIIPLEGLERLMLVPRQPVYDEISDSFHDEYLRDWAIMLTPLKAPAQSARPAATLSPDAQAAFDRAMKGEVMTLLERRTAAANWQSGDDTVTVYATDGGTWYHVDIHCSGMMNAHPWDIADAVARGKRPCPDCIGGKRDPAEWEEGENISW